MSETEMLSSRMLERILIGYLFIGDISASGNVSQICGRRHHLLNAANVFQKRSSVHLKPDHYLLRSSPSLTALEIPTQE